MSNTSPAAASSGSVLPRFSVQPYRADGGASLSGMVMLITALVLAGGVLGFLAHLAAQFIYLIVLFPILIGVGLGFIGVRMIKAGRVRNPWISGVAGFLGGILAMAMMHYFDYRTFRAEMAALPPHIQAIAELSPAERQELLRPGLNAEERKEAERTIKAVKVQSLLDFMNFQAQNGIEIKKPGSKSKGINLGYYGSCIYWAIETLIVAGITYGMTRSSASEPYCVKCDRWKRAKVLGWIGDPTAATAAVNSGDLEALKMVRPSSTMPGPMCLAVACCDGCVGEGAVDVKLQTMTKDSKGNVHTKEVSHMTYPAEALPHLVNLFAAPAPQPAAANTPAAT